MNGACLKESLFYYTTTSCNDKNYTPKLYKGSCEASFKKRYSNYKNNLTYRCTNMMPSYYQSTGT